MFLIEQSHCVLKVILLEEGLHVELCQHVILGAVRGSLSLTRGRAGVALSSVCFQFPGWLQKPWH